MFRSLVFATAIAAAAAANAQAPAAPATAAAPSSPAKKELAARILKLLQPAIEAVAQQLATQPALQMQQAAAGALQRIPAERREALARDLEADLRKYAEETVPAARERAIKLAPSTIGPLIEERFTEDELRQIVALLESPVNRKFQQTFPEMQRALGEKLVAEMRGEIEPRVRALDQTMSRRLGLGAASAPGSAAPAARPAAPASGARR